MKNEDIDRIVEQFKKAAVKAITDMANGICHVCGAKAEPSTRIGRCIYNACGHRRGQAGSRK